MDGKITILSLRILMLAMALLFVQVAPALASTDKGDDDKRGRTSASNEYIVPGWVVVKFKAGHSISAGASKTGIRSVDAVGDRFSVTGIEKMFPFLDNISANKRAALKGLDRFERTFKMQFDPAKDPVAMAAHLSKLPEIEYAEPLYRDAITQVRTSPAWFEPVNTMMAIPNDARFNDQVYFDRFAIREAWDVVKAEGSDVVVAVIDGGTDWTHEDMQANLWVNPGEIDGNGIDDDGNGFVDDINGWNFANNTNDPKGLASTPDNARHGTQTAGLIGAQTNNGIGIAGTSWNATYLPINASSTNDLLLRNTLDAMVYAITAGADIINASFGSSFGTTTGQDVADFAHENGTLIIAAAGNNNRNNNDLFPYFPANYNHVLSVGATSRSTDRITSFSHVGVSVDVFAPGSAILSTAPANAYLNNTGTSFSAPIVAGVAALVKAQNPAWGPDQVREQVRATADDISSVNGDFVNRMGKGRVNALRAVTEATPAIRVVGSEVLDLKGSPRLDPGEVAAVTVFVTNFLEPATDVTITLESDDPNINITQPTSTIATLNPGDTTAVEFQFKSAFDTAPNYRGNLVAKITSGDYTDVDAFLVDVNSTIHNTGNFELTLTDQGNLGYEGFQGSSAGGGIRYLGFDFLFEGGLITGTGVNTISDNVRDDGEDLNDDFVQVADSDFGIIDGRVTKEEGALQLVDSAADTPLNILVRQDSYADDSPENDDFVVLKYTITNTGSTDISNFHAGLFFDWDSFDDPGSDHARYDASRKMGYFLNNTPQLADVFLATKLLTDDGVSFRAIDNTTEIYGNSGDPGDTNDGFTNTEKWNFISDGIQVQSLDVTDISILLAGGPYDIAAGASIEVAFAIVGGTNEEEIAAHADAAQALWDNDLSGLSPNPVSNEDEGVQPAFTFALAEPYPNPVRQEAVLNFELPAASEVELKIFDVLGREVKTLASETMSAGKHSLAWDGRDNAGIPMASGLYLVNLTAPTPEGLKTATKKLVLVR